MMRPPQFEAFVAPARAAPEIWRLILSLVIGVILYILLSGVVAVGLLFQFGYLGTDGVDPAAAVDLLTSGETPELMATLLATFVPMVLLVMLMALIHKRRPRTLFGPLNGFWRYFLLASAVVFVIYGGILLIDLALFGTVDYAPQHSMSVWLGLLIWAIPLLFVQITAEEMVFRGFLQQQMAARFSHSFWWMILPSILFAAMHYDPAAEADLRWMTVLATGIVGLAAADLTRVTGNLGAAMGLHFTNNAFALLLMAVPGQLSGLALYHIPAEMADVGVLSFNIVILLVVWVIIRRVIR